MGRILSSRIDTGRNRARPADSTAGSLQDFRQQSVGADQIALGGSHRLAVGQEGRRPGHRIRLGLLHLLNELAGRLGGEAGLEGVLLVPLDACLAGPLQQLRIGPAIALLGRLIGEDSAGVFGELALKIGATGNQDRKSTR